MAKDAANTQFATMNAVRGIAAICVAAFHATQSRDGSFVGSGYFAVDVFFCLSGFVIAHAYERKIDAGLGLGDFLRVRLVRLYPAYALGLALGVLDYLLRLRVGGYDNGFAPLMVAIVSALMFMPDSHGFVIGLGIERTDRVLFPFNGPSWSLFFELCANLGFLVFRPKGRAQIPVLLALAALFVMMTFAAGQPGGWGRHIFLAGFPRALFAFYAGVALYRLWGAGKLNLAATPIWVPIALTLACCFAPDTVPGYVLMSLIAAPAIVALSTSQPRSATARKVSDWLGDVSYPLYAIHLPLLGLLRLGYSALTGAPYEGFWPLPVALAAAALATLAAFAVARFFDAPVRRWLGRKLAPAPALAAPSLEMNSRA